MSEKNYPSDSNASSQRMAHAMRQGDRKRHCGAADGPQSTLSASTRSRAASWPAGRGGGRTVNSPRRAGRSPSPSHPVGAGRGLSAFRTGRRIVGAAQAPRPMIRLRTLRREAEANAVAAAAVSEYLGQLDVHTFNDRNDRRPAAGLMTPRDMAPWLPAAEGAARATDETSALPMVDRDGSLSLPRLQPPQRWLDRIAVRSVNRIVIVQVDTIARLEAEDNYVRIWADRLYLHKDTLSGLVDKLDPARFLRVHRSHAINIRLVREL